MLGTSLGFGASRWDPSQIPDLSGCVAIVTGGNTGLGYVTCLELARHGAKVYMASRTESKAEAAIQQLREQVPGSAVEFLRLDLTDLKGCKAAAAAFLAREQRLDILVNNAGIMATPYELSKDGIELQACNGVGHFAFTIPLLSILKATAVRPDAHVRIVNVSSVGHNLAQSPDFSSLEGLNKKCLTTWNRYGNSKLSNILFTNELQKKLEGTGIYCLSAHPGMVATDLYNPSASSWCLSKPLKAVQGHLMIPKEKGALTQLYAATSPEVESKDLKAAYLVPFAELGTKSKYAEDKDGKLGGQFWALCEKLVAEKS